MMGWSDKVLTPTAGQIASANEVVEAMAATDREGRVQGHER